MAVDKMESIKFAEWIAKNHYVLCNETKDNCYWQNEDGIKTTDELYVLFGLEWQ